MKQQPAEGGLARAQGGLFYGWWIVIIGCILDAVKGGTFNSGFTLYFLPILNELQLSRAATSLPFSLAKLEAAVEGPLVGFLIDRIDLRVMLALGTTLAGLGFVLLSYTHSYFLFLVVFMGLLTMGFQMGFNHAIMAAVNHWFLRKRGLAMAIVQTGQAIGGVAIFPLVALAVLKLGWRHAAFLSGIGVLALVPLVLLVRRSPESMGLLPDGEPRARHTPPTGVASRIRRLREPEEYTASEALRTTAFWLLAAFHGLRNVPYAAVSVHLVPLLVWKGLNEHTAAFFVGLTAFSAVVVRPLTGWLGDRWSKQKIGALGVILGSLGLVVLTYSNGALWHMVFFAILFSFADGVNSVTWALVGDFFGRNHFASIRGWIGMIQSLVAMPAAVYTGWIFDQTQSYTYALLPFIVIYVLAGLVLWQAPRPRRPQAQEVAAGQAINIQPSRP
ncbi:MAG TPA: MFS transporter [Candidatus Tectomicrobia bacterium]|nr:MFS transporter [Candidatus Tectomicrobia bacterium]